MPAEPRHQIANLECSPGELSFEARVGGRIQPVWLRTEAPIVPTADAALTACLMPAMCDGGTLELSDPVSPRLLRTQREFQAIQRAWSPGWPFGDPPLREVEVTAPTQVPLEPRRGGRVAAFFSGGVDSWATVIGNPDVTDLVFVRGLDILPRLTHQGDLAEEVEARLREAAEELALPFHVVETNLRELTDPHLRWEVVCGCATAAIALFLAPLFERVMIAGDIDHEAQPPMGPSRLVDQLLSTEHLEIVDDGGRFNREQRLQLIVDHPVVQRSLRVCWENPGGAYNCGRCRKCMLAMISLEAIGARDRIATFPPELDLDLLPELEIYQEVSLALAEDVLDTTRAVGRTDLEQAVEKLVAKGRRSLGLAPDQRLRRTPGPPPSVRVAAVVPVWNQARYLAPAVESALAQEAPFGVGVVIVNDGCPDPETERIAATLRDAHPDRVAYLRQPNRGLSAARNAGIRQALLRWPQLDAIFPLDADNQLSRHTLATLMAVLEAQPRAAWATPALEFFGAEEGEWQIPGPYLPYRQLLANQCDAGSLVRRAVFDAGIEYDETMREGFEDWEFFLRATLAGLGGIQAGRCGFRYRRRLDSMLATALPQRQRLEAEIQRRHPDAYEPAAMLRREHAEAPRFALVRCDHDDVLLTACCDLEPKRQSLIEFARSIAAAEGPEPAIGDHIPAVTLLTTAATIECLEAGGNLAEVLFRIQSELRAAAVLELRIGSTAVGLALRARALDRLTGGFRPETEAMVEVDAGGETDAEPPSAEQLSAAAKLIGAAVLGPGLAPARTSHSYFLEQVHIETGKTLFPWGGRQEPQPA
jgi:glycosyltransferase involved in cell wall biosynthesis